MGEAEADIRAVVGLRQAKEFNPLGFDRIVVNARAEVRTERGPKVGRDADERAVVAALAKAVGWIGVNRHVAAVGA